MSQLRISQRTPILDPPTSPCTPSAKPFVTFEIPAKIRLVGEVQAVGYLLDTEIGGLEEDFDLQGREIINHFLAELPIRERQMLVRYLVEMQRRSA